MAKNPNVKELLAACLKELHLPVFRAVYEELARQAQQAEQFLIEQMLLEKHQRAHYEHDGHGEQ